MVGERRFSSQQHMPEIELQAFKPWNIRCCCGLKPARLAVARLAPDTELCLIGRVMAAARPSQSAEDYLERIHELIEGKGYARVVDIASSLKVRQASVTSMVQKLAEAGYLKYEKYRGLILTERGRQVASQIHNRHETLSRFFSLFGLDPESQRQDIEGIEHHLSPDTVAILSDLAHFFEKRPAVLRQFRQTRQKR